MASYLDPFQSNPKSSVISADDRR